LAAEIAPDGEHKRTAGFGAQKRRVLHAADLRVDPWVTEGSDLTENLDQVLRS